MTVLRIQQPEWYLSQSKGAANVLTNAVYLIPMIVALRRGHHPLALAFLLLTLGSTQYHINPSTDSLFVDRLSMLVVFGMIYNYLYPKIPTYTWIMIGIVALLRWRLADDLSFWLTFQALGVVLLVNYAIKNKILSKLLPWLMIYITGTITQLINSKYSHPLKHILTGISIGGMLSVVL